MLAECALERWGAPRFHGFSAGSQPKPAPHPCTLETLRRLDYDPSALRSKSWNEFAGPDAPKLDFVFTVCDSAAGETCPVWPGQPMTAHWGVADPAAFEGDREATLAFFRRIYFELEQRIKIFVSLPVDSLDRMSLQERLDQIGKRPAGDA